jgi:hypothetical protein
MKFNLLRNYTSYIFCIIFAYGLLNGVEAQADKDAASKKIHELTQHMIVVIKDSKLHIQNNLDFCTSCSHLFKERHIYQRTIDIENHLNTFLRMYGSEVKDDDFFKIREFTFGDIYERLSNIDEKLERTLQLHHLDVDHSFLLDINGTHTDFYSPLDRLEKLLLTMGSPSIKPDLVMKRAILINQLVKSFCKDEACISSDQVPFEMITPKLPKDVFLEIHKLIKSLHKYALFQNITIDGGVTAPKPTARMIMVTPRVVNRTAGVVLADLIAMRNSLGYKGDIVLPKSLPGATPTHVWYQINNARLFLDTISN